MTQRTRLLPHILCVLTTCFLCSCVEDPSSLHCSDFFKSEGIPYPPNANCVSTDSTTAPNINADVSTLIKLQLTGNLETTISEWKKNLKNKANIELEPTTAEDNSGYVVEQYPEIEEMFNRDSVEYWILHSDTEDLTVILLLDTKTGEVLAYISHY